MPNVFKSFLRSAVSTYRFPDAAELPGQEAPPPEDGSPEEERQEETASDAQVQEERPPGTAVLEYARIQAEEILKDARRQAEQLLEQARDQAGQEAEQISREAREEGFRQGFGEGLQKAALEGRARQEEQRRQEADRFSRALEDLDRAREELLEQTREELCELALTVAEKVIHVSLRSSREVVVRMIQAATEKLRRREWVHIYVGGCEARALAQITPELTQTLAGLSDHIKLIPMAGDEPGTIVIEMPDEIIDASASTQLDHIRDVLKGG